MTHLWPSIIVAVGGLGLILYGLELATDGLRTAFGGHLRTALTVLTVNRLAGLVAGVLISFLLSSSSVATILLVNLAAAGFLAPRQAIGVVLGCAIGSTLTVQLIAFASSSSSSIPFVAVLTALAVTAGILIHTLSRYRRTQAVGSAVLGLGLLFLGLASLGQALAAVAFHPLAVSAGTVLGGVFLPFVIGIVLGAAVRSVAACALVIMLAAGAAQTGASPGFPLAAAILIVLGANIGTSLLPVLVGVKSVRYPELSLPGSSRHAGTGLQVALAELFIKVAGAVIAIILLHPFTEFVVHVTERLNFGPSDVPGRQVANAHMIFNLANALVFLPLAGAVALLMRAVVPGRPGRAARSALLFVDPHGAQDPETSLQQAHAEAHRMGSAASELVERSFQALLVCDEAALDRVEADDEKVDLIDTVLTEFLIRLPHPAPGETPSADAPTKLTDDQAEMRTKLLLLVKVFEKIADQGTRELVAAGRRQILTGFQFTPEAAADLARMHRHVQAGLGEMLAFLRDGKGDVESVLAFERDADGFKQSLQTRQLERISREVPGELETSIAFVNALDSLRVCHYYVCEAIRILSSPHPAPARRPGHPALPSEETP